MEDRYFVETPSGERHGPADLATLKGWAAEQRLEPATTLISERTGERMRADAVGGLFGGETAGAPPIIPPTPTPGPATPPNFDPSFAPPAKKNSTLLVVLAVFGVLGLCTVPILAAILLPVFSSAKRAAQNTQGLLGMKQLGIGLILYEGDHDDHFPPSMRSARAFQPLVGPYVKDPLVFGTRNPQGGEILGDDRLSLRLVTNIENPPQTIVLFDSLPWSDGRAPVARADGSAKILPHESIAGLMAPDPFGGLTIAEERRREAELATP